MIWPLVVVLIQLHGPGNQVISIDPSKIVSLRDPASEEHFARGVRCIINTEDGKFSIVLEDCATVGKLIEEARK